MVVWTLKTWLGFGLGILSFSGLIVNLLVVIPVFRLAFLQNKSPIYVISFINIVTDIVNVLMATCYLAPSIMFETYFFTENKTATIPKLMGSTFMFCWYLTSITQIVMAVNRVIVICFRRSDLFTRTNICKLFCIIIPFCFFLMYMAQYGTPCCFFVFDHVVLSYSYNQIDGLDNYPNMFIDLPLNTTSSTIATICYAMIVWTVRQSTKGIASSLSTQPGRRSRKNREVTYAMQFCFISMFYTFSWITFRVFPIAIGDRGLEWFICISAAVTINSSANALVYLISNQEVWRNLKSSGLNIFNRAANSSDVGNNSTDGHSVVRNSHNTNTNTNTSKY
ncbi:7TM GPCR serpentine receptor class x (Srx) domain-containing protein [Caenorhabditis elegans]|uniref:7TM GPCR serpentine receptor class x (Srx) domain-containing protein n=1 Tax=Caenorhabditis elegans TaxID=6239 RepID=Q21685_CAEEL|nr:7TM GPCR serpentine receptor class x (Srx) domain-containing protein [Caenorhabditis elegans]CCD65671.1 7TM GPCR serpentine receptor class x (Srx) domain-containing protein [Caenorhabditis elegans]|eukprot:NP_505330.1 Serpentine Receptor, class X [Caenorhabditis elegans]